jgi:D-alanyl-D-alanine carboxypeptidase
MGVESVGSSREASRATQGPRYPVTETEHLLEAVIETGVTGAVVVAEGPVGRVEAAAGVADVTTGEPLAPAHFRIGSVTKIFVTPLVLRFVEEGLLDLYGEAAPFAEGITIRQLLNHTSGLDDFIGDPVAFFEPYRNDPNHRWELDARDELELVLQKPRLFEPGHGWAYHGSNYIVLRLLVEEATGSSLRHALRERIFEPLGLGRTDLVEGPLHGDCARGYLPPDNPILPGGPGLVDVTGIDVPFHGAGGGIVSTAGEVATLLRALLRGELLSKEMRTEMLDAVDLGLGGNRPLRPRYRRDDGADGKEAIPVRCRLGPPGLLARLHRDRAVERGRRAPGRALRERPAGYRGRGAGVLRRCRRTRVAPLLRLTRSSHPKG